MKLVTTAIDWVERGYVPDGLIRWGIRRLCRDGLAQRDLADAAARQARLDALLADLKRAPIAIETRAANEQHYELPPEFFTLALGPRRKYSACYWPIGVDTLEAAEVASLEQVCRRAEIADGQDILELGCGWGSLTLWLAERYPSARILAVSNSAPQRRFIIQCCAERCLNNVEVVTADMNDFAAPRLFDRVVSIEMFEHMRNYERLMTRIAHWLRPEGKLFVHIFSHRRDAYTYEIQGPADWMSRYFFTGGVMPSDDLLTHFEGPLWMERRWRLSGVHYQRTAEAWLSNLDARRDEALAIFREIYGSAAAARWLHRWRVFFMSCAEMFGLDDGEEWGVSHYRFARGS